MNRNGLHSNRTSFFFFLLPLIFFVNFCQVEKSNNINFRILVEKSNILILNQYYYKLAKNIIISNMLIV